MDDGKSAPTYVNISTFHLLLCTKLTKNMTAEPQEYMETYQVNRKSHTSRKW
jgi:hypothetical protein